jgi:hypothetical protein
LKRFLICFFVDRMQVLIDGVGETLAEGVEGLVLAEDR